MTVSFENALEKLLAVAEAMPKEMIPLEACYGRILAEDITALENVPSFDRSSMDGYALKSSDLAGCSPKEPRRLTVIQELGAGQIPKRGIISGEAIKVMTGGIIPDGADAVIKFEDVIRAGDAILVSFPVKSGNDIMKAGEDIFCGQALAVKGSAITPSLIGILASLGYSVVSVFKRPKVAIINTGNELSPVKEKLEPAKIRNSNGYSLGAYCISWGADPLYLGIARDEKKAISEKICDGLAKADIVVLTGGASVGDYDLVKEVLADLKSELLFNEVGMKPGKPTAAVILAGKPVIGLSGNPAAALTVFLLLVAPMLKKMGGYNNYLHRREKAALMKDFPKLSPQRRLLRGRVILKEGKLFAEIDWGQKNSTLVSMLDCNAFIDIPAGTKAIKAGEVFPVYLFDQLDFGD